MQPGANDWFFTAANCWWFPVTLAATCQRPAPELHDGGPRPELADVPSMRVVSTPAQRCPAKVATGRFGADMKVSLVNDGPVTFWLGFPQARQTSRDSDCRMMTPPFCGPRRTPWYRFSRTSRHPRDRARPVRGQEAEEHRLGPRGAVRGFKKAMNEGEDEQNKQLTDLTGQRQGRRLPGACCSDIQ